MTVAGAVSSLLCWMVRRLKQGTLEANSGGLRRLGVHQCGLRSQEEGRREVPDGRKASGDLGHRLGLVWFWVSCDYPEQRG